MALSAGQVSQQRLQHHSCPSAPPRAHTRLSCRCQAGRTEQPDPASRRAALALLAAAPLAPAAAAAAEALAEAPSSSSGSVDTTVTNRIYLDVGLCAEAVRVNRTLGDKSILCTDPEALGRIEIELFGRAAPGSVTNILAAARAGAYDGSQFSKVLPGRYLLAGVQGPRRMGYVQAPDNLPPNPDILSAASFRLPHLRPGTVSLNLSENEDDDFVRFGKNYRNLSFLITTGPGPVPSLNGENIVIGQVTPGSLQVIRRITEVPTFTPNDNAKAFNQFASFIGDERAAKTRAKWGKPLQAVVIVSAGML